MISYIKFCSAVALSLIFSTFIYFYTFFQREVILNTGKGLPYITTLFVDLNSYIFCIPAVVIVSGFFLLKKDIKWLELYWHLWFSFFMLLSLLCFIAWALPNMNCFSAVKF
jgi:hypothetical protein